MFDIAVQTEATYRRLLLIQIETLGMFDTIFNMLIGDVLLLFEFETSHKLSSHV